jgi:hypothetical protein
VGTFDEKKTEIKNLMHVYLSATYVVIPYPKCQLIMHYQHKIGANLDFLSSWKVCTALVPAQQQAHSRNYQVS